MRIRKSLKGRTPEPRARSRRAIPLVLVVLSLAGSACGLGLTTKGSGRIVTKVFEVQAFTRVDISRAYHVRIVEGDTPGVILHVDDNLVNRVVVRSSGGTLFLGLRRDVSLANASLRVDVTTPDLSGVDLSDGAGASLSAGFSGDLVIRLSEDSVLSGTVDLEQARIALSEASRVTLRGRVGRLFLVSKEASRLTAVGLDANLLNVELAEASWASIGVTESVSARLRDASVLQLKGSPIFLLRDISTGSKILGVPEKR